MALELRLIAVGAAFDAAISTFALSLKSILPEPAVSTSASEAVLTWSANTWVVENAFFDASELRSVTASILVLTFWTAVAVSFATRPKAAASTPVTVATAVVISVWINARSVALLKSRVLSASLALSSVRLAAFVFTTSATERSAASNASDWLAPAPSAAAAKAFTTLMICWLAFSTARASAALTSAANALNVKGSTPSGSPKTSITCAAVRPPSSIKVLVGVTTVAPEGAFKVTPDNTVPLEVSIVLPSVTATIV